MGNNGEYSSTHIDDLVRLWRSKVKVTAGRLICDGGGTHFDPLVWKYCFVLGLENEKERKSIYIAPFMYYVYLKALRHKSHSFTCKYTMPALFSS